MFRTLSAAAAFAVIATTVLAQSDLVAARKAVMDGFGGAEHHPARERPR